MNLYCADFKYLFIGALQYDNEYKITTPTFSHTQVNVSSKFRVHSLPKAISVIHTVVPVSLEHQTLDHESETLATAPWHSPVSSSFSLVELYCYFTSVTNRELHISDLILYSLREHIFNCHSNVCVSLIDILSIYNY